jgi:hypothetical protein
MLNCNSLIERRILGLDHISLDGVLDTAVRNDWEDRSVNDAKVLSAEDLELRVDDAFFDGPVDAKGATGIWKMLAAENL